MSQRPRPHPAASNAKPRTVLAIGGLDPAGFSGLLADARALEAAGVRANVLPAILTEQSRSLFAGWMPVPEEHLDRCWELLQAAGDIAAIKVGALGGAVQVRWLKRRLAELPATLPVVLDPVLAATAGGPLLDEEGRRALLEDLLPHLSVITPNAAEAQLLEEVSIGDAAASATGKSQQVGLRERCFAANTALLVKGELRATRIEDRLHEPPRRADRPAPPARVWTSPSLHTPRPRGTGCALASLIAAHLAQGEELGGAVDRARQALQEACAVALAAGRADLRFPPWG